MENLSIQSFPPIEEIQLTVYDSEIAHFGGSQYWFPKKNHQLSGCGPVAAANITAYLSKMNPEKFSSLYPYEGILNKKDFIQHMVEVRKHVKPGIFGLTSVDQFAENVLSFSKSVEVALTPHILKEEAKDIHDAIEFILEALHLRIPVAILVLKHPVKELEDYTWHWMTITNLKYEDKSNKYYISVSTYGEHHEIDFNLLWNHRRPTDVIRLAYFT